MPSDQPTPESNETIRAEDAPAEAGFAFSMDFGPSAESSNPGEAPASHSANSLDESDVAFGEVLQTYGVSWINSLSDVADRPVPRIGRFEVLGKLGSGGFGDVLKVRDTKLCQIRAMKLPRGEAPSSSTIRTRFLREGRAAATLDHPNVVMVYEAEDTGLNCYLIMEYCEGGSLAKWIADRGPEHPIPLGWVAQIVKGLAKGVHHAHKKGIFHRDLKPSNVLLSHAVKPNITGDRLPFTAKLGDFGLAKILDEPAGSDQTASDALVGTLAFMAPEQARRSPAKISAKTDVYGLGTILYALLTGRKPFADLPHVDLVDHILHVEPTSPRTIRPEVPPELDIICRKCLAKNPNDRYATAQELADDLGRWLGQIPITGRKAPIWRKPQSWSRRHPVLIGMVVLILLAVGGGLLFAEAKARQDAASWLERMEAGNLAGLASLVAEREPGDPRVTPRLEYLFANGPDHSRLAAAVFLAATRSDSADFAFKRLLGINAGSVKPLSQALRLRMADLPARLRASMAKVPAEDATADEREDIDQISARAAACLVHFGEPEPAWQLLRFQPNPQTRSFLIHELGPVDVGPDTIFRRLQTEPDASIRLALIQSLGQVPEHHWNQTLRDKVREYLLEAYTNDPNSGVHGSAKWLLKKWKHDDLMDVIDEKLSQLPKYRENFGWRISPHKITFVLAEDRVGMRLIEMSDTEVTAAMFQQFRPLHNIDLTLSPDPSCPVNSVNYNDAAEFLNWLGQREGVALSYAPGNELKWEPVENHCEKYGYRLPTVEDSILVCRANTTTRRFFGNADSLVASYAWVMPAERSRFFPVATVKPNDFGVFDMLGNAFEIGQMSHLEEKVNQASLYGGSALHQLSQIRWDYALTQVDVDQRYETLMYGFRIVRTVKLLPEP